MLTINLPQQKIFSKLSPKELYIKLKQMWFHNDRLRCYHFPIREFKDPCDGSLEWFSVNNWKISFKNGVTLSKLPD